MPECSFCKKNYDIPRGLTFVLPNGEVLYFCSSKCQKNNKLGRVGRKTNWVRKVKKDKPLEKSSEKSSKEDKKQEEKKEKVEEKSKETKKE